MGVFFFLNSILLGAGLAMDAFAVSLANGLAEPELSAQRSVRIAGTFALFQTGMPLLGWLFVHNLAAAFSSFQQRIPLIALILLVFLGVRMILRGIREHSTGQSAPPLRGWTLFLQGIAPSIDALSVGFTIAGLPLGLALLEAVLIGLVTFAICLAGLALGKRVGTRLVGKAAILGGAILIFVGLEIFFLR